MGRTVTWLYPSSSPWKPDVRHVGATQFRRHPDHRRRDHGERPVRADEAVEDRRAERGKQRQRRDHQRVDQHGHPRLETSVHGHHARDPVERAGEVDRRRHEPQRKGPPQTTRFARQESRLVPGQTGDRDKQRCQRDPAERGMTELWKTEREEEAGGGGERVRARQRVIQGLNCSSFFSFAATVSASRRVGNLPIRTR